MPRSDRDPDARKGRAGMVGKRKSEPREEDRPGRQEARRKRILTAIGSAISAVLAFLAVTASLSDPETLTLWLFGLAALTGWLTAVPIHWYAPDWAFWTALASCAVLIVVALVNEASDPDPSPIFSWRTEHAPLKVDDIPTGDRPRAIAAHEPYVWIVGLEAETKRGRLWRIDRRNLGPPAKPFPSFEAYDPFDIAVDDEAVWVTAGNSLIKLNRKGKELWRETFGDGGDNEVDVRFGRVWFKETSMGKVFVIDPDSGDQLRPPVQIGLEAVAIAVGHRSVWVSSRDQAGKPVVVRLAPDGTVMGSIDVPDDPQDLVAGPDYVYVAHSNEGTISRIDPGGRGRLGRAVPGPRSLEGSPPFGGIDAGSRTIWAPFEDSNNVFAIAECNYRAIGHTASGESPYDVTVLHGKAYVPNFLDGNVAVFRLRQPVCVRGAR
jgi:hypothetical protein